MTSSDRDEFTPIRNPYIVGNPVDDARMFFGREEDFEYIRNKISIESRGGLLVLCGTRRSGKTSILFQIRGGRLGPGFVPVLIDMQSVTVRGDAEFLDMLQTEIGLAMSRHGLQCPAGRAGPNPHAAFRLFTEELQNYLQGNRLVLLFDEYELFETQIFRDKFTADVLNLLAGWMESRAGVFMVFTGSERLEARDAAYWQHFLGKALHRRISFLGADDLRRLITEPVRGALEYADGVVESIRQLTAGQPFYTQVICQGLIDRANAIRSRHITPELLDRVVEDIIENPLPQMIFTWSSANAADKATMAILAELNRAGPRLVKLPEFLAYQKAEKVPAGLGISLLQESLERLFHGDLLDKSPAGDAFIFRMDLWRRWVARMHSIWQVVDEIGAAGRDSHPRGRLLAGLTVGVAALALTLGAMWVNRGPSGGDLGTAVIIPSARPDSATLDVRTVPAGALAWLGGELLGRTPIIGHRVAASRAVLRLELAGFLTREDTLTLSAAESASFDFPLTSRTGGLHLTSEPAGAAVWLEGRDSGLRTPCPLQNLRAGQLVDVELRLEGFDPRRLTQVRVEPDSVVAIDVRFDRRRYRLTILTTPRDAEVRLDGRTVGQTPLPLDGVEEGPHVLIIERDGYSPDTLNVAVPVANHLLEITLDRLPPGILAVELDPYADVWIDGRLEAREVVNKRFTVEAGEHTVEFRHPLKTVSIPVVIRSGEVETLRQNLR